MYAARSRRKWRLCILIGLLAVPLLLKLIASLLAPPSLAELTELDKCPTCFGVTMCPAFMGGHVTLGGFDTLTRLANAVGTKNVMYGTFRGSRVVLKKLGSSTELHELDDAVCAQLDLAAGCAVNEAVWRIDDLRGATARLLAPLPGHPEHALKLRLCPTTRGLMRLLSKVITRNRGTDARILDANVWTLALINPEPLILQMLPAEEGWPVPRYLGACGRVAISAYAGRPLADFTDAPWSSRARISLQLLTAAAHLTDKHPDFGFYLTDVSADNIAVDDRGIARFVDLEHVVVVDKNPADKDKPAGWHTTHTTEPLSCSDCFAFSAQDICSHRTSDHNYWAVCTQLLAADAPHGGGMLRSPPPHVLRAQPLLPVFLRECATPTQPGGRMQAARELMLILANLTADTMP